MKNPIFLPLNNKKEPPGLAGGSLYKKWNKQLTAVCSTFVLSFYHTDVSLCDGAPQCKIRFSAASYYGSFGIKKEEPENSGSSQSVEKVQRKLGFFYFV